MESIIGKLRRRAGIYACTTCLALLPAVGYGADCTRTSVGFTPLNDLSASTYQGFAGGLFPGGWNFAPSAHANAAFGRAQAIEPLDANGNPSPTGSYVLLSIGMSNTHNEFERGFIPLAAQDPDKDPNLVVVNGAQSGQQARVVVNPDAPYWSLVESRLASAGVTANQVAVAWVKEANSAMRLPPPDAYRQELQENLEEIARLLLQKFPNIQIAYFSNRTYAGYATTELNPEPYAYESGFVVKWVIEKQINRDASLNFDSTQGFVNAPLVTWGPNLWADGLFPRSDGLTYECADFGADGTHPSPQGSEKVGEQLINFFSTNASAREWYLENPGPPDTVAPAAPMQLTAQ